MKIFASILAMTVIASAAASPVMERQTASSLCGPLDTPQCCGTDILGLADLGCSASMIRSSGLQLSSMLIIILQSLIPSRRLQASHPIVLLRARLHAAASSRWYVCQRILVLLILNLSRSSILPALYALVSPERTCITALAVDNALCISVVSSIISSDYKSFNISSSRAAGFLTALPSLSVVVSVSEAKWFRGGMSNLQVRSWTNRRLQYRKYVLCLSERNTE
jgi:hypothetical protein